MGFDGGNIGAEWRNVGLAIVLSGALDIVLALRLWVRGRDVLSIVRRKQPTISIFWPFRSDIDN